jgi:hypothetical protein
LLTSERAWQADNDDLQETAPTVTELVVDEVISAPAPSNLLRVRCVPAFLPLADHS